MTILVKNTAISVERFIAAEALGSYVRVYMDGLPAPNNYIHIHAHSGEAAKDIVKIIHEKIGKKA